MTTEEHVIEMSFNSTNNESNKSPPPPIPQTHNDKYVYAILYDPEDAAQFVKDFLKPVASTAEVTYDKKDNIYLLWVLESDAGKIPQLVQTALDNGKYIYINDGSDVMFRPGMKYNQLNHQRIQLMNYRCYLDKNDVKKFKKLIRPIFLNKKYWITEDGQEFAQIMKDAFVRTGETVKGDETQEKAVEYKIDHQMIRKWVDKGLIYAQYESLKFKRQDYKREFEKTKDVNYNTKLLESIKSIEEKILDMRRMYKRKLMEAKNQQKLESQ